MLSRIKGPAARAWLALAVLMPLALAACNTTEGLGRDVRNTGNAISNEADEHK